MGPGNTSNIHTRASHEQNAGHAPRLPLYTAHICNAGFLPPWVKVLQASSNLATRQGQFAELDELLSKESWTLDMKRTQCGIAFDQLIVIAHESLQPNLTSKRCHLESSRH